MLTAFSCYHDSSSPPCPAVICPIRDYEIDANREFCYRYVQTPSDYFTANVTCTRERAAIVYIGSSDENAYISSTYFTGRGGLEFWIGMNDLDREGTFKYDIPVYFSDIIK